MHLAPWVFPIDYSGRKPWTRTPRLLLLLLLGPVLLIGALNPLASVPWQERILWGLAGLIVTTFLALCTAGYRRLAAFVDAEDQKFGAVEERHRRHVRPPADDEPLDPGRRPIALSRDPFELESSSVPMPADLTSLHWWRPNYWQRVPR